MNPPIDRRITDALGAVDAAIAAHTAGSDAPLSLTILARVRSELEKMREHTNSKRYLPTFPRFVMDWPDETGLVKLLVDVAYEYGRSKR